MVELTIADLEPLASSYQSSRAIFDVLIGEDPALPLIEAISSGDNITLRSLLSQPQWTKIALEKSHFIYRQSRPSHDKSDVREVYTMALSNLERAVIKAAVNGQAAAVSTLLSFASQNGLEPSSVITRWALDRAINNGHAAVIEAMASADPSIVESRLLGHGTLPLDQAVKRRQTEVVAVLLQFGTNTTRIKSPRYATSYNASLLSNAAKAEGPRMTELLLKHGVSVNHSGALHLAAERGALDTMRLLMQHGADVNEQLTEDTVHPYYWSRHASWTPMHFAAHMGHVDAMKLLESNGARSDVEDGNGRTAAELLEQRNHDDANV